MSKSAEQKINAIVIGAGGVGVVTAYSLYHNGVAEVSLVTRSDYDHVVEFGYKLESCDYGQIDSWKPHNVYKTVEDASAAEKFFDYIIVTTKNIPDGPKDSTVHAILKPVIESNHELDPKKLTNVVLVQNGIDIEKEVLEHFEKSTYNLCLLSGVQLIASTKVGPGHVVQKGKDNVSFGSFDKTDEVAVEQAKKLASIYHNEGHNTGAFDDNVRRTRWNKLLYNAAINTTTALVGLDVSRCFEFASKKESTEFGIFRPAMQEIAAIAASENIAIDEDLIEFFNEEVRNIMYKPSMCVDVENGRLMELEILLGNPIRTAKANGVQTPTLCLLYNLLILVQNKLKEQKKLIEFNEETLKLVV
ncbi:unnamed protein product [Kluyveromyces dobzhanskii CBS 2104]|uniref:WGS project CCBQ000000000 data, contig 00015 n=1 Tax=Kluyveromyces dobzhanskii CBS 2104 TaxID=1427455 RepID=A0A0A8L903_9SACH|nr:unnamed protein product [Kluyveromyces dobzhanskii CBS 2104]